MGLGIQQEAYNYFMSLDERTRAYVMDKLSFVDYGKTGFANMSDIGASIMLTGMQWFSRFFNSNNSRYDGLKKNAAEWRAKEQAALAEYHDLSKRVSSMDELDPKYKETVAARDMTFDHWQTLAYLANDSEQYAENMNTLA